MRSLALALWLVLPPALAAAQGTTPSEPADLCAELQAFADKAAEDLANGKSGQAQPPGGAGAPRSDTQGSGTQGGGSVGANASNNTQNQASAPPTTPVSPGASNEPASSPHASGGSPEEKPGGLHRRERIEELRRTAEASDRQACRQTVQELRREGAQLPAALLALAAYEPDASRR